MFISCDVGAESRNRTDDVGGHGRANAAERMDAREAGVHTDVRCGERMDARDRLLNQISRPAN